MRGCRRCDRGERFVFDHGEGRLAPGRLHHEAGKSGGRKNYVQRSLQRGRGVFNDLREYRLVKPRSRLKTRFGSFPD